MFCASLQICSKPIALNPQLPELFSLAALDTGARAERRNSAARPGPYSSKRVTAALRLRTPKEQPTRRTRDGEPARQRRLNGKAIEPGADHGAGNRGAPRGARAHRQPDMASDARQARRA